MQAVADQILTFNSKERARYCRGDGFFEWKLELSGMNWYIEQELYDDLLHQSESKYTCHANRPRGAIHA